MTNWPEIYLDCGLRLVPMLARSKTPYGRHDNTTDCLTGWSVFFLDTYEQWLKFLKSHSNCNLAVFWPGVQLDADNEAEASWLRAHGIAKTDRTWILRTARGYRMFYAAPDWSLSTFIDPERRTADLLAPGRLAVVPPSVHPTNFPYHWLKGYSPLDIALGDLSLPPAPVIEFWQLQKQPVMHHPIVIRLPQAG